MGNGEGDLLAIFNADDDDMEMPMPTPPEGAAWSILFDTGAGTLAEPRLLQGGEILRIGFKTFVLPESRAP
jgi:hypothetical protein